MIPIGDDNKHGVFPIVTIGLIVINVLVFLYELSLGANLDAFFNIFATQANDIRQGQELYSLITSIFLHSGWLHLLSNMLYLWIFGDNVEAALGHGLYLAFYLVGGVVASLAFVFMSGPSNVPAVGASGAIGAVLGAYVVMFPNQRIRALIPFGRAMSMSYVPALLLIGVWAVGQFVGGFNTIGSTEGGVGYWAHIGGFVFGALVGMVLRGTVGRTRTA